MTLIPDGQRIEITQLNGQVETAVARIDAGLPVSCQAFERPDKTRGVALRVNVAVIDEASGPQLSDLKTQMVKVWEVLPVEVRVIFRPLKTAVLDAINDNCLDEVALLIQGANVPAQYADSKKMLLDLLKL